MKASPTIRLKLACWVTVFALAAISTVTWALNEPRVGVCEAGLLGPEYLQTLKENIFIVSRDFAAYRAAFGSGFLQVVDHMKSQDSWVDFGSGEARAQLDVLKARAQGGPAERARQDKNRLFALALNFPDSVPAEYLALRKLFEREGRFEFLGGRLLEEIPDSEIELFDIGTDYFGPLTYTLDLSSVLNKYLRRMRAPKQSHFFTVFSESTDFATMIYTLDGKRLPLSQWLQNCTCLEISPLSSQGAGKISAFEMQKRTAVCQVPDLELVEFRKNVRGLIVWRAFREKPATAGR